MRISDVTGPSVPGGPVRKADVLLAVAVAAFSGACTLVGALLADLFAAAMIKKLTIPPATEYIIVERFAKVNPISSILISETVNAAFSPRVYRHTITTRLASPSFIPGIPIGIGIIVSIKLRTMASAISIPYNAISFGSNSFFKTPPYCIELRIKGKGKQQLYLYKIKLCFPSSIIPSIYPGIIISYIACSQF